jgi:hypothetical protein
MSDHTPRRVNLCCYSKAVGEFYLDRDGFALDIEWVPQDGCPLGLSRVEAARCPCKRRVEAGETRPNGGAWVPVQVAACLFPMTWNGDLIRNPAAFAAALRRRRR